MLEEAAKSFGPMMKLMSNMFGDLSNAFYKKYGKDALPIIAAVSAKSGVDMAKIVQKMMPVKNMKDFAELYKMMMSTLGEKMEIVKVSDDMLHFKVSYCTMGIQGTNQQLCEAMINSDKKMVSTLLGQQFDIKILKSLAAGDKYCEYIYSKK
jgi:predicted hydrocarbon binding protein